MRHFYLALLFLLSIQASGQESMTHLWHFNPTNFNPALTNSNQESSINIIRTGSSVGFEGSPKATSINFEATTLKGVLSGTYEFQRIGPFELQSTQLNFAKIIVKGNNKFGLGVGLGLIGLRDLINPTPTTVKHPLDISARVNLGVSYQHKNLTLGVSTFQSQKSLNHQETSFDLNKRRFFVTGQYSLKVFSKFSIEPSFILDIAKDTPAYSNFTLAGTYKSKFQLGLVISPNYALGLITSIKFKEKFFLILSSLHLTGSTFTDSRLLSPVTNTVGLKALF